MAPTPTQFSGTGGYTNAQGVYVPSASDVAKNTPAPAPAPASPAAPASSSGGGSTYSITPPAPKVYGQADLTAKTITQGQDGKYYLTANPSAGPVQTSGLAVANAPVANSGVSTGGTPGTPSWYSVLPNAGDVNAGADAAESYLANPGGGSPDDLEEQLFQKYLKQSQDTIGAIEKSAQDQIKGANDVGDLEKSATGSALVAAGLSGSTAAAPALGKTAELTEDKINAIISDRATKVQGVVDAARNLAITNAPNAAKDAIANQAAVKAQAADMVKTLSENHIDWGAFKNTDSYKNIVAALGGDANYADALFAISKPAATVVQSYVQGQNYVQVVRDPQTGAVSAQTFDLGFSPPPNWQSQKVGTQGLLYFDPNTFNPNDPSTFKYFDATNGYQGAIQNANLAAKGLSIQRQQQLIENSKALEASRLIGSQVKADKGIQNFLTVAPIMDRLNASLLQINSGDLNEANAADLLDAVTQLNTGGKTITEGQIGLTQKSQSYADQAQALLQKVNGSGGIIDKKVANDIATLSKSVYDLYEKAFQDHTSIYNDRLKDVNGQDLSSYSPITDITKLKSYVDGSYDNSLQAGISGGASAGGDGAVPVTIDSKLVSSGFTKNADGSYSYGDTNYTYDSTSGNLIDDQGNEVDPNQ